MSESNAIGDLMFYSLLGGFVVALAFVLALPAIVPRTDGMWMEWGGLQDPLVLLIGSIGGLFGGMVAFLLSLLFLKRVDLQRSFRFLYVTVVAVLLAVGLLFGTACLPTAFLALPVAMSYCKRRYSLATN